MVIEYSIDAFDNNSNIDEIAVVIHPSYIDEMEDIVRHNSWKKVKRILKGGNERYMSSLSAIESYRDMPDCNMIIHDAARPLVSDRIINDVVEAMAHHDALGVAIPVSDTIFRVNEDKDTVVSIPQRSYLFRAQTPQAFKYRVIDNAYRIALKDPSFVSTDDCGVVANYLPEVKIHIVNGDENNIKLTYPGDIPLLEKMITNRNHLSNH